ncbi:MAG TPA: pilus assembly protein N-terminal domain-containing protein [Bauldia sp.]|nr:pilus assembly protein N-terminal domain-containing protein [Bauldia sp.]
MPLSARSLVLAVTGGLLLSGAAAAATAPSDETSPIQVVVDQAKVMHIARPADIVIIGNPAIADATIQDDQTLIITGHSFGTTNLIVLDRSGQPIADAMVTVAPQDNQVVTVYSRASRQTFSCTPDCAPVLAVGDSTSVFDSVNSQVQSQNSLSSSASGK